MTTGNYRPTIEMISAKLRRVPHPLFAADEVAMLLTEFRRLEETLQTARRANLASMKSLKALWKVDKLRADKAEAELAKFKLCAFPNAPLFHTHRDGHTSKDVKVYHKEGE